ncbi:MAG: D-mannonate oxidoreductase, partial [Ruminococcaceae bacterium]|nr:D-mannonate oxidoreductase [Oscillospiraceae bacterium]
MKLPFKIDLSEKVAVVTGGGGVLCSSFSEALAECGASVAV